MPSIRLSSRILVFCEWMRYATTSSATLHTLPTMPIHEQLSKPASNESRILQTPFPGSKDRYQGIPRRSSLRAALKLVKPVTYSPASSCRQDRQTGRRGHRRGVGLTPPMAHAILAKTALNLRRFIANDPSSPGQPKHHRHRDQQKEP